MGQCGLMPCRSCIRASALAAEPPALAFMPHGLTPGPSAPSLCLLCRCVLRHLQAVQSSKPPMSVPDFVLFYFLLGDMLMPPPQPTEVPACSLHRAPLRCRAASGAGIRSPGAAVLPVVRGVMRQGAALEPVPAALAQVERLTGCALIPAMGSRPQIFDRNMYKRAPCRPCTVTCQGQQASEVTGRGVQDVVEAIGIGG